jgi:hypothetical protein
MVVVIKTVAAEPKSSTRNTLEQGPEPVPTLSDPQFIFLRCRLILPSFLHFMHSLHSVHTCGADHVCLSA